jgi:hypothetical protein
MAIRAKFDPLGINIEPIADRDLGRDSSMVVLVTMGLDGKLKLLTSLL